MPINSCTPCTLGLLFKGCFLVLHLNIAVFNFQTMHKVRLTLSEPHCSNVVAVISTAQMSFRGAKRRGNPQNRNEETVAVATDRTCFRNHEPRRKPLLSVKAGTKTPATVLQDCLLGLMRLWRKAEYSSIQTSFGYHRTACDCRIC